MDNMWLNILRWTSELLPNPSTHGAALRASRTFHALFHDPGSRVQGSRSEPSEGEPVLSVIKLGHARNTKVRIRMKAELKNVPLPL